MRILSTVPKPGKGKFFFRVSLLNLLDRNYLRVSRQDALMGRSPFTSNRVHKKTKQETKVCISEDQGNFVNRLTNAVFRANMLWPMKNETCFTFSLRTLLNVCFFPKRVVMFTNSENIYEKHGPRVPYR